MRLDLSRASILSIVSVTVAIQACGGDDSGSNSSGGTTTSTAISAGPGGPSSTSAVQTATSSGTTGSNTNSGSGGTTSSGTTSNTTDATSGGTGGSGGDTTATTDSSTTGEGGGAGDTSTTGEGGAAGAMITCESPFEDGTVSEGGAAPFAALLVNDFGEAAAAEQWNIWPGGNAAGGLLTASVAYDSMEGNSCEGALQVNLPWDQYGVGQQARLERDLGGADWTGGTTLHMSIRFEDPGTGNLNHIAWGDVFFQNGNWSIWSNQSLNFGMLSDFEWHEITVDLTSVTATPNLAEVNSIGVELGLVSETSGTPPATTFYVDDIWVE
jgi:hypothetical protein